MSFIDNSEIQELMDMLEAMEDEALAMSLLKELNDVTSSLGKLLLNTSPGLSHEEWKLQCDEAKKDVESVIAAIKEAAGS